MVALRICVLVISVCINRTIPNKSVFRKMVSVTYSNLKSMFFIVLRRVTNTR